MIPSTIARGNSETSDYLDTTSQLKSKYFDRSITLGKQPAYNDLCCTIEPENVPPIEDIELLARYVTQSGQFRSSDNTVKQDLFMPHPREELSLTRLIPLPTDLLS